ncbi:MAG: phosphatase PAP2 family protein [Gammaproteobacteria bacterium]|nr:phosphatase PAP2 family protein [Gammaproteobacteria bacterium]MCF6362000.1 phosphatase PAP2 family protein [Gammaproteobacteria bacterium]
MGRQREEMALKVGSRWLVCVGLLTMLVGVQGCSSLPTVPGPSSAKMKRAALAAATDPNTWLPALGASLILVTDRDQAWSDWARREQPVFASAAAARRASDGLLYTSLGVALASSLWMPKDSANSTRPNRLLVQMGAMAATASVTYAVKVGVGRSRSDGSDTLSFPSGHASVAFTGATLTRRNLARLDFQAPLRTLLDVGAISLAAGTAWARLEAGVHYPSDVLAGAALGNFVAAFVNDAFLREGGLAEGTLRANVRPLRGGAVLQLTQYF